MQKIKLATCMLIVGLLALSLMTFPAFAETVPTFILSASSTQLQFNLPEGTTFNGSVSTTGTLRFWVTAPNGGQVANLGLIDQSGSFSFVAQQTGNYSFNFENDLPNPVKVTFSYTTNPDISVDNTQAGLPWIYLSIPVVIAVVGSVLIVLFARRKNKKNRTQSPRVISQVLTLSTKSSSASAFSMRQRTASFMLPWK
jgi:hypothetical protein